MPRLSSVRRPLALLLLAPLLPGCIVKEIRDGIYNTNDSLAIVQQQLNELRATNQKLDRLQTQLDGLDTRLQGLDQRLSGLDGRLKDVDAKLGGVNERLEGVGTRLTSVGARLDDVDVKLRRMDTIDASLKRLDVHLASLRVTIEKINSSIPFFDFGGGDAPPAATEPGAASQPAATQPASRPRIRVRPASQPTTAPAMEDNK